MALVIADRVRETTTTTGTGSVTLAGAYTSFQTFSAAIGNANSTYYTIASATSGEWEVGIGTYTSSGNTLSRDTVLASSTGGTKVSFSSGTKDVFVTQPSERSLLINSASNGLFAGNAAFTSNGVLYANSTTGITSGSALTFDGTTLVTTTLDATNLEVTNVKALDGTAAFSIASSTGVVSIDDTKFTLQDETDNTKKAQFQLSGITTANTRTYTLPNSSGTIALLSGTQTFSGATTFSSTFTLSGTTTNISLGASQTTGTWTAGGTAQTGAITLGQSTGAQTLNLGTGATTTATTKTINLGTGGVSGSTTTMTIGSTNGTTVAANGTWTFSGTPTFSGGTANGVLYLDGSKVATSGSALTFNGTNLGLGVTPSAWSGIGNTLQVNTGGSFSADAANAYLAANSYYNGTNWIYQTTNNATRYTLANNSHIWYTAPSGTAGNAISFTQAMTLDASGNLGIGVTPSAWNSTWRASEIQRAGNAVISNSVNSMGLTSNAYLDSVGWKYGANGAANFMAVGNGGGQFVWYTAPSGTAGNAISFTQAMTLDASGNLGIGTSSPSQKLNVNGIALFEGSAQGNIIIQKTGTNGFSLFSSAAGTLGFYDQSAGAERARIDSSGNFGIGTSSPAGRLDSTSGSTQAFLSNGTATSSATGTVYSTLAFRSLKGAGSGNFAYDDAWIQTQRANLSYNGDAFTHDASLLFFTNNSNRDGNPTEKMRLDSFGNLGLGVTPGTWSRKAFQIEAGGTAAYIAGSGGTTVLSNNVRYNSGDFYINTSYATYYAQQSNGAHVWAIAPSGTAGNAISFTQAMTLDASGNLLVGTTSISGYIYGSNTGRAFISTESNGFIAGLRSSVSSGAVYGLGIQYTGQAPNSTGNEFLLCEDSGPTLRASIRSNGGLANYSANNVNLSDERLKKDFQPAPNYYDRWTQIDFCTFLYKDQTDDERNLGVRAQQLETVCPELVDNSGFGKAPEGEAPYKAVYQTDFQYATAVALQEAIKKIEQLAARVAQLEGQ